MFQVLPSCQYSVLVCLDNICTACTIIVVNHFLFSAIGHLSAIYYVPEGGVLQVCLTVLSAPAGSLELPLFIQVDDFCKFLRQNYFRYNNNYG